MIGANLCSRLVAEGYTVAVLTRPESSRIRLRGLLDRIAVLEADITDGVGTSEAIGSFAPDTLFHLAGTAFNPPTISNADHLIANVVGAHNVIEAVRGLPGCRLIHAGSAAEYPPASGLLEEDRLAPINVYGAVKACASVLVETYARMDELNAVRLVFFTVYGPWERSSRLVPSTIRAALEGRTVEIADGSVERDFVYIDDALEALVGAMDPDLAMGASINVCSGVGTPIREVAGTILALMGQPVGLRENADRTRSDEIRVVSGDNRRARNLLNWQPRIDLEDGLTRCVAWYRQHQAILDQIP